MPHPPGMLDQVQAHCHVGEEEAPRVVAIGADPAHLGRQVHHDVGLVVGIQLGNGLLAGQVILPPAGHHDVVVAFGAKLLQDE